MRPLPEITVFSRPRPATTVSTSFSLRSKRHSPVPIISVSSSPSETDAAFPILLHSSSSDREKGMNALSSIVR